VAQCLNEGETQAVLLRKKGWFAAVLCRAERYIRNFYLKGPDWGALKAVKRYIRGAQYPGKKYIALMGFAQGTEEKELYRRESIISGER